MMRQRSRPLQQQHFFTQKRKRVTNQIRRDVITSMSTRQIAERAATTLAENQAYRADLRRMFRELLKHASTLREEEILLAAALMFDLDVVPTTNIRRRQRGSYAVDIKERTRKRKKQKMAVASSSSNGPRPGSGGNDDDLDRKAAKEFFMMWRFRRDENPIFRWLSKDTALRVCYFVLKDQIDPLR